MLTVHCSGHDHFVDLTPANIESLELRGARVVVRWRCWCGHRDVAITRAATAPVDITSRPLEAA